MSFITKAFSFFMSLLLSILGTTGLTVQQKAKALRVVAYIIADNAAMMEETDESHLDVLTDIILIGSLAGFDTDGNVNLSSDFSEIIAAAKAKIGNRQIRLHLNLLGPWATANGTFEENMFALGEVHREAFGSGVLEENIKNVLEKYKLDGVFFDYEFPVAQAHKDAFSAFLVSLDETLGGDYILGAAESSWCAGLSKKAIRCLDMVEVMCYDIWDEYHVHSSFEMTRAVMKGMLKLGYKRSQLDMGIPFYARPTTEEAYWYDYKEYYDKMDENGYAVDPATGLTASFNTPQVVYEKTDWAIKTGFGGVMIWHYACDLPADNAASLFNAAAQAKADLSGRSF
ncbi:MAG: glycoside hydrolase family 18 protein [Clostridia bacterium]|nr:glycoside hydrolase family 18 protein [Clostridia bacterium]